MKHRLIFEADISLSDLEKILKLAKDKERPGSQVPIKMTNIKVLSGLPSVRSVSAGEKQFSIEPLVGDFDKSLNGTKGIEMIYDGVHAMEILSDVRRWNAVLDSYGIGRNAVSTLTFDYEARFAIIRRSVTLEERRGLDTTYTMAHLLEEILALPNVIRIANVREMLTLGALKMYRYGRDPYVPSLKEGTVTTARYGRYVFAKEAVGRTHNFSHNAGKYVTNWILVVIKDEK